MTVLKLKKMGNSVGAIFPQDLLTKLNVKLGDTLHITDAPDGVRLTPYDPEFERQMDAARRVMRRNRNALRELAR